MTQKAPPEEVLEKARELLGQQQGDAAQCLEISGEYFQEGDWLHLIVHPKPGTEAASALDFVDVIQEIESKLREDLGEQVLIVPAKP